jgi:hypothetical protein
MRTKKRSRKTLGSRAWNQARQTTTGEAFLEGLAESSPNGFPGRFARTSTRLRLGTRLDGTEVKLLYRAAFLAALCRISFNGPGGCAGRIAPEKEGQRIQLEQQFMAARDRFWTAVAHQLLRRSLREAIQKTFFNIVVKDEFLAP